MNAENGQNFVNKSEFQCPSADGASAMNLSLHGIVSDFHGMSIHNSTESRTNTDNNDLFTDRCSMCRCTRIEDSDQELSGELSKEKDAPFDGFHWLCPTCERLVEEECKLRARLKVRCSHLSIRYDSYEESSNSPCCPCINCQSERESTLHQKKEFQKIWAGVAEAIGHVFSAESAGSVLSELDFLVLKSHVTKLCQMNCHYLFKKLEKRCRQMVINMKVHILKRVTLKKTDTPETAYNFMSIIHRKYHHLCKACDILADVLSPLVEQHMRQFNATWQLHNKYLFCCVIFNEPIVQKCLPDAAEIIRQDVRKRQQEKLSKEQESILKKYSKVLLEQEKFANEMSDVCLFWKKCQQNIEKYDETYEIEKMKERKHCLIDGLEFIKKQRQLLKEIQGGCLLADVFDSKKVESFEKLWILGRANETCCPNCKEVKCSYDEAGMSHLITCGIISPEIISEEGLSSPSPHEKQEHLLNSASVRSASSSSNESFLAEGGHLSKDRRRGDGGVSSEDDEDEDDDEEEEDDDDDDDDDDEDFHDAQQIHLPDFCPSIENASSKIMSRCNQSFLLQSREISHDCNCIKGNKDKLCLLSYSKAHGLEFMLKSDHNGDDEDEDDDDDEDYDIHEEGIHTSSDLEYAAISPLNADVLLKRSHFLDYSSEPPKSIIENFIDFGTNQSSTKSAVENDFNQRFLLPTLEQQCIQERTKRLRSRANERQLPPPSSSPISCSLEDINVVVASLEDQVNASVLLSHHCASRIHTSPKVMRSPEKSNDGKVSKTSSVSHKSTEEVGDCEIKLQRNDVMGSSCDRKSGKDRSTQHPEKISSSAVEDKKSSSSSACNYYQVALKHQNSCQKQPQPQHQAKSASQQQKSGSGDCGSVQSVPQQAKQQGSFTVPQQPVKQQPFQCRAPTCNGHMVGAGDGGMDKEECDGGSPHPHLLPGGCESDEKSLGGQKDPNGKSHCECWHCEFFGHETQSNAPTSKNFAECRDRLRQKLKKKQSSTKMSSKSSINLSHSSTTESKSLSPDQSSYLKSVEELIDFINGGKKNTDQSEKERRKDAAGPKKKSGKNKKTTNGNKPSAPETLSNVVVDKKSDNYPQSRHSSNSPSSTSSKSMQSDAKANTKSKVSDMGTVTAPSSQSSLENSVPILKINSSKKFEIPPTEKETNEIRFEHADKEKAKRYLQKIQQEKASPSPKTNAEIKITSAIVNQKIQDFGSKINFTPPPSPHCKSKRVDRKTSDDRQKIGIQKVEIMKMERSNSRDVRENGSFSSSLLSASQKQVKPNISTSCILNGTFAEVASKSNGNCLNTKTSVVNTCNNHASDAASPNIAKSNSHASAGSSSPPGTTKNKKQKKRNKICSDLSFEEIFKPNDEDDLGEDDREIEEFKRFCFNTPPLPVREKLRVNLNVKDIFNRRKPPQSCNS